MAILVTGGAGYIGSFVVRQLIDEGHVVVILDDFSSGYRRSMPGKAEVYHYDMLDRDVLHDVFSSYQISTVIHLGAKISVPESFKDPLAYYNTNVVSTSNLLHVGYEFGVANFVLASSAAVYGNQTVGHDFWGQDPGAPALSPSSPYGWSKLMAEQLVRDFANAHQGFCYANLRFFNVGGANGSKLGPYNRMAGNITKRIASVAAGWDNSLNLYGDGHSTRDYIHVIDVADAVVESYRYCRDRGGKFTSNVAAMTPNSINDLITVTEKITGKPLPIKAFDRRAGDVDYMVSGGSTLHNLTGWKPLQSSIEEIMRSQIEWERSKYWEQI